VTDLAVNIVGGLEGGLEVIGSALGQAAKRQASEDLAQNVDVEGRYTKRLSELGLD